MYLFAIWKLPRLRFLTLQCKAVMMFNLGSLDYMPCRLLKTFVMDVSGDEKPIPKTSVPRLSAYRCCQSLNSTAGAGGRLSDLTMFKWRDHWNLPRLTTLDLDAPQSQVFSFKWPRSCPSLEIIQLTTQDSCQRLPLSSWSRNATILPITPSRQPGTNIESADDIETGMAPLVESAEKYCPSWPLGHVEERLDQSLRRVCTESGIAESGMDPCRV